MPIISLVHLGELNPTVGVGEGYREGGGGGIEKGGLGVESKDLLQWQFCETKVSIHLLFSQRPKVA